MNSAWHILGRCFVVQALVSLVFAFSAPGNSFSQETKKEVTPAAAKPLPASPAAAAQKSGALCGKSATQTQVNGIAAKLREFQAKQQAKKDKNQAKVTEATNRKP